MELNNRRIVVTGGAGFIGSHLVDALVPLSPHIMVVDNLVTGRLDNISEHIRSKHVTFSAGDVRDLEAMEAIIQPDDIVFHLAVECLRVSLFDPVRVHKVNATGTLNVCLAAHRKRAARVIYVSSSEVYGSAETVPMRESHPLRPTTTYGADKAAGELIAQSLWRVHGLPVVVVRPFNSYGPREHVNGPSGEVIPRFVAQVLRGSPPIIFGDGAQTRDFTWVTDTARGILLAAQCDALVGQEINIARGQEVTINQIAELVLQAAGRTDLTPIHRVGRPGDVRRHLASVQLARELLGFQAATGIEAGITRYVEWVLAQSPAAEPLAAPLPEAQANYWAGTPA